MICFWQEEKIGCMAWRPLARGFLAGTRPRAEEGETTRGKTDASARRLYYQESDYRVLDRVTDLAKRSGISNAQIALAWLLHKPAITSPIIAATKPHHFDAPVKAPDVHLSDDEIKY